MRETKDQNAEIDSVDRSLDAMIEHISSKSVCKKSATCSFVHFCESETRMQEISVIAEPLLNSDAFNRLESITFLGILSPCFSNIIPSPLFKNRSKENKLDGCRKSHSLGVALIALDLSKRLKLSAKAQKYAVAWGLLHDIATWPLSHTGEPAFSEITRTSSSSLREMMIMGSSHLPQSLTVDKALNEIGIEPGVLLSLFHKNPAGLESELQPLWQILRSPITPDSLEGMWRTGLAFGIDVPHPKEVQVAFSINLFNIIINKEQSRKVISFWRRKAEIYKRFINRSNIIFWESTWSRAVKIYFHHLNLVDSLSITEEELINTILKYGLPKQSEVYRYKQPLSYYVYPQRKQTLYHDQELLLLHFFLRKVNKKVQEHGNCTIGPGVRKNKTLHEGKNLQSFLRFTEILL